MSSSINFKKMINKILLIIILIICFFITTFAVMKHLVVVEDNLFQTGSIKINLNDGNPIIEENELLFEPGMTLAKQFFVENQGTFDVYYKIYFDELQGDLIDVLNVTIKKDDDVIYNGTPSNLNKKNVDVVDEILGVNDKHVLDIIFHYPENANNSTQGDNISFIVNVDAIQVKNNPNRLFE